MTHTAWIAKTLPILLAMSLSACGGGSGSGTQPDPDTDPDPAPPWPPTVTPLPVWTTPDCETITGPPIATFSTDGGITLTPNDEMITFHPDNRTQSIVPLLAWGGRVFATQNTKVYNSVDGGCTWELMFDAPEPLTLVAQSYPSYAFGIGARGDTLFVLANHLQTFDIPFHAIDIASTKFSTLHALSSDGHIMRLQFDTFEQDEWIEVTVAPASGESRFLTVNPGRSPNDPAHLIVSMASGPPMVTLDGGNTWTQATGIEDGANSVQTGKAIFSQEFIQQDAKVVWMAVERTRIDPEDGEATDERVIVRSTDGGRTFSDVVVADGIDIQIDEDMIETNRMSVVHGTEEEMLFTSGMCPDNEPKLYHYRAEDDSTTIISWDSGESYGVESLHYLSSERELVYFGHRAVDTCD